MSSSTPRRARWGRIAVATLVAVLGAGTACGSEPEEPTLEVIESGPDTTFDHDYVIPAGTGVRIDKGEEVEIVPRTLQVRVGERIRIVNEDDRGAAVGIFWVPAGRTVAMEFTEPGVLTGECDIHPSGQFTLEVSEA